MRFPSNGFKGEPPVYSRPGGDRTISTFGRPTGQSRAAAIVTIAADWADHYSPAASYLRQSGILPPIARPAK